MKRKKIISRKRKLYKKTIAFIILDICVAICFFIMYGPWGYVRNLFVTTAMKTMNHKYLAEIFYSKDRIEEIMSNNYFVPIDDSTNVDDINIDTADKTVYKDEYEKQILSRDNPDDLYKMLEIKVGNAKGYLTVIYDPTKIQLLRTTKFNAGGYGERIVDMCKRYGGVACINAGGFTNGLDNGFDIPKGYVIDNGQVVWTPKNNSNQTGNIIGINYEGKLTLLSNVTGTQAVNAGLKYGVEFGPFLIVNGQAMEIVGMPYGVANKCVIAQRQDGIMLFLVTEGETYIDGASLQDVINTLTKYGAYNAANLDGGQSTQLVINNQLINTPNYIAKKQGGRYVVTGWGLIP